MRRWSIGLAAVAWLAIVAATGVHVARKQDARSTPAALQAAVSGIALHSDWPWQGDLALAEKFSRRLHDRKKIAFGAGSPEERMYAHQGNRVHAEVRPDGVCFLVNVIDDVADPARDVTLAMAWRTAREVVGETQGPEARLVVGLRHDHGWLAIAAGRGADVAPPAGTVEDLAGFFGPAPSTTAAAATPAE